MFNIVGKKQKALYQRELTRIMIALERKFSKKIKPIIGRQYLDAAKLVESGIVDIDQAVNDQSSRLADTLKKQYYTTATLFSDEVFNAFEETQKGEEIPHTKGMREDFWTTMISWIKIHGAKKVVQVDDTTKESMRTVILKGVSEGKSYKKIATDLRTIKESASRVRSMRIARTEVHTSAMKSTHTAVISTGVKSEKEWIATIDERTRGINIKDKFNHVRANGERVKDDERFVKTGEPLDYPGDPEGSAANIINCLTNWRTPIFTDKGWKPVRDIKRGDKVLTSKNRFKKVVRVRSRLYNGEVVTIRCKGKEITVTSNHEFLTDEGGWKRAKDIVKGDKLQVLASYCTRCNKIIPYFNKYCSISCCSKDTTDRQWSDPNHRKNMSKKASLQMKREYKNGIRDKKAIVQEAHRVCFERYGKKGYLGKVRKDPVFEKKIREGINEKYGSTLDMLKLHAFPALGKTNKGSSLEKAMAIFLKKRGKEYIAQYPINRRRVDFYVKKERLFIECDGYPFHQDERLERKRDLEILLGYSDHRIAHVTYKTNPPKWEYYDLNRLNHTKTFQQISMEVREVIRKCLKGNIKVYNFAVEDDESYIAKGFVTHNCRCVSLFHILRTPTRPALKPVSIPGIPERVAWKKVKNIEEAEKQFKDKFNITVPVPEGEEARIPSLDFFRYRTTKEKLKDANILGNEIAKFFDNNPEIFKLQKGSKNLQRILLFNSEENNRKAAATYLDNKLFIGMRQSLGDEFEKKSFAVGEDLQSLIRHEYAHHIDETIKLSDKRAIKKLREEYTKFYKSNPEKFRDLSLYAATDDSEGIAEAICARTSPLYGKEDNIIDEEIDSFVQRFIGSIKDL